MITGTFTKNTTLTAITRLLSIVLGVGTSILLARLLGPEGKGIYTMAALLPGLIVTFGNLGVGPATVYYVARGDHPRREILGNSIFLALVVGSIGVLSGLILALFFHRSIFPGIAQRYLLLALVLIPGNIFFAYLQNILLGAQRFNEYNLISVIQSFLFLAFMLLALWALKAGVVGALAAGALSWFLIDVILFFWTKEAAGGISFKLNPDYIKRVLVYGIQAHIGNVLAFLNYRIDMFLVNGFLNPAAVGFYSLGVGLVEKLWLISQAASTVLFPRVAAETDAQRQKDFTPLVARTVLWITALGALAIFFLARWLVVLLYSEAFLPAVRPLQILLPGIVALSVGRVLANDIAGRGRVMLNNYTGLVTVATNVILNILWIPRYGISGAALASTVSYTATLVSVVFFYCRLSGNHWTKVLLPQRGDWTLYRRTGAALTQRATGKMKALFGGMM